MTAAARLAGGVAHDLNNLLSVINGYSDLLASRLAADPDALRELAEIQEAGRKATALSQQLLVLGGSRPHRPRVVDLAATLREQEAVLVRCAAPVPLRLVLPARLPPVRLDPEHFLEALAHLVRNARDASPPAGAIALTARRRTLRPGRRNRRRGDARPGPYVSIAVQDDGPGVSAEVRRHLFEPYFSTKPEGRGTGLGLALAYGTLAQQGGFLGLRETRGDGAVFEILLPAVDAPVTPPPLRAAVPVPANTRGHETIFVVEPDALLRKMLEGILTADGYQVQSFAQERAAETALRARPGDGDLLIANGHRAGKFLRAALGESHPRIRLLHLSDRDPGATLRWPAAPRWRALAKPFALSELLRATRELLDRED